MQISNPGVPCLVLHAATVIGSDAKGTMNRSVEALKRTYEMPVFPQLDAARSLLGARTDTKLAHVKARHTGTQQLSTTM